MSLDNPELCQRLAAHPFLTGMTPQQFEILCDCALPARFEANEIVFRAGDPARGFYLIESGRISVEGVAQKQSAVTIDVVSAGEPLGWSWIFEPFICQYGARALEPATAIFIDAGCLAEHRGGDLTLGHELFKRMSQVMVRRLNAARAKLLEAATSEESRG